MVPWSTVSSEAKKCSLFGKIGPCPKDSRDHDGLDYVLLVLVAEHVTFGNAAPIGSLFDYSFTSSSDRYRNDHIETAGSLSHLEGQDVTWRSPKRIRYSRRLNLSMNPSLL